MSDWSAPQKPAELAESRLVSGILSGFFPVNSTLPPERELAEKLGVTRPTLREALQRIARDGWIEIHHGRATRVRDYWREGNLLILAAIARRQSLLPPDFIPNLLHVRLLLAPEYSRLAVQNAAPEVIRILEPMQSILDDPAEFARLDLELHYRLTILSGNPVFTLILNGFSDLYKSMGNLYFSISEAREHSRSFYHKLLMAARVSDLAAAEEITHRVMLESIELWKQSQPESM